MTDSEDAAPKRERIRHAERSEGHWVGYDWFMSLGTALPLIVFIGWLPREPDAGRCSDRQGSSSGSGSGGRRLGRSRGQGQVGRAQDRVGQEALLRTYPTLLPARLPRSSRQTGRDGDARRLVRPGRPVAGGDLGGHRLSISLLPEGFQNAGSVSTAGRWHHPFAGKRRSGLPSA